MAEPSPPLDLSALARETIRRVSKGNNSVRFIIEGHDETIAFSTNADAVKVWDLLRRLEAIIEAALVRVQQGTAEGWLEVLKHRTVAIRSEVPDWLRVLRALDRQHAESARLRGQLEQALLDKEGERAFRQQAERDLAQARQELADTQDAAHQRGRAVQASIQRHRADVRRETLEEAIKIVGGVKIPVYGDGSAIRGFADASARVMEVLLRLREGAGEGLP